MGRQLENIQHLENTLQARGAGAGGCSSLSSGCERRVYTSFLLPQTRIWAISGAYPAWLSRRHSTTPGRITEESSGRGRGQVVVFKLVEWLREEGVHLLPPPDRLPASSRPAPEVLAFLPNPCLCLSRDTQL
jgi:hypothetical protein